MDEPKTNPTENNANGQVMDVTAPKSPTDASPETTTVEPTGAPEVNGQGSETAPEPTSTEPSNTEGPSEVAEAPADPVSEAATDAAPTQSEQMPPLSPAPAVPKKKRGAGLIIAIAIIIALGIAGAVVYAYMSKNKAESPASEGSTSDTTQTQEAQTKAATTTDVDNASKEVDTTLSKSTDSSDFSSTSISDQSLGL